LTTLYFNYNPIVTLNASGCTVLSNFNGNGAFYSYNGFAGDPTTTLTTLNLTNCSALPVLYLAGNTVLNSVQISGCSALTTIYCYSNDVLPSLNASNLPALTSMDCNSNPAMTTCTVNANAALTSVNCYSNPSLTSLVVTNNPVLTTLYCISNALTSLNATNNSVLNNINCSNNNIVGIDVRNGFANAITLDATVNSPLASICKDNGDNITGSWSNSVVPTYAGVPTGAATQTFCNFAKVSNLSASGTSIKWYTTATGGSPLASTVDLVGNTTYYASQTLGGCEGTVRLAVNVVINVTPVPTASAQTFCNSATVANLVATGTAIKWYSAATGGTALTSGTALATGTYYATQTLNSCESATRTAVAVTLNVTPSASASAQTFCNSATVANLTATGTAVKWYAASTGGSALVGTTALSTGTYYVTQTLNSCESATRTAVSVTVNVTPAATASAQTFCNSATVANLTATGTAIKWYSASTGGSALVSTTSLSTGTYYVTQTLNSCESAIRTSVAVTVNVTPVATASAQTFCNAATVANLTATGTALKWYSGSTGGSALASSTALATGTYYVTQTLNSCESATRTAVSVTLNVTPAATASAQTFCNAATVANLVGTGTALKWYTAPTGGSALVSTTSLSTGTYYVTQTLNSCESATRTSVAITVNVTPVATASAQTFCNSATVANLVATGTALQWYSGSSGGSALVSTTALSTGTYYVTQTLNSCESATRTPVSVTVNVTPVATASAQTFCNAATVANLTATGSALQWYAASTGGSALISTTALSTGTYYLTQTINSCESATRTAVSVTLNVTPVATASAQTFCSGATVANLVATGTALKWYSASTGGSALLSTTALSTGTYYVTQTLNSCESATRTAVSVTVNTASVAPTGATGTLSIGCGGSTTLTVAGGFLGTGATTQWFTGSCNGNLVGTGNSILVSPSVTTTYYVRYNGTCNTTTCGSVTVTVGPCSSTVNLKLFIQGYYDNTFHAMRPVMFNQGLGSPLTDVGSITVELHNATAPFATVATTTALLKTNGTATCTFSSAPSGSFYIAVKTGAALQTWSKTPQTVGTTPLNYDFTTAINKAHGDNMIILEAGVYGFYAGDFNHDGNIDTIDYPLWETDSNNFESGLFPTDLNGDGNVDTIDYPIWEENSNNFISMSSPN